MCHWQNSFLCQSFLTFGSILALLAGKACYPESESIGELCMWSLELYSLPFYLLFKLSPLNLPEKLWLIGTLSTCLGRKLDPVLETLQRVRFMASLFANFFVHFIQKKGQLVRNFSSGKANKQWKTETQYSANKPGLFKENVLKLDMSVPFCFSLWHFLFFCKIIIDNHS